MTSPESPPGAALTTAPRPGAGVAPAGRVLIVDDDQALCEVMEMTLQRRDLEITWRTSPHDAFDLIVAQEFDVVLTDLAMPAMSGLELCARIAALRPDVPVIIVSGNTTEEAAADAIRVGAYELLAKPVDGRRLALTVSRAILHRRVAMGVNPVG